MAHVAGEVVVRRPVDEVFDFVADVRNEPLYNPSMVRTELLTPEPVGLGTRSRAELRSRGRTVEVRAEITAYERPTLLGSRHRSSVPSSRSALDTHGTLTFEPVDEGTRMRGPGSSSRAAPTGCWDRLLVCSAPASSAGSGRA